MSEKQLHQTFAESEYGKKLEQNIRFGDFKPAYISNEIWETLLGDDVNNLRHMLETYKITRRFTRHYKTGAELLRLTAITHDWGEAVVGDIALPDKEAAGQDLNEVIAYNRIAKELGYEEELAEVPMVAFGDHELAEPFRVIEYIGYCRTGIRAGLAAEAVAQGWIKLPIPRKETEGLMGGLLALNKAVMTHNYRTLAGFINKYPHATEVLSYKVAG